MFAIPPKSSIVILTGAGISKESGLDTFRDTGGIWQRYNLEDVCTPEGFKRNPAMVHDFYNQRRMQLTDPTIQPNAAHKALAQLAENWQGKVTLVTQNIDDLHERGGSRNVIHMHGELLRILCTSCGKTEKSHAETTSESSCVSCKTVGQMRPDIVWFGEMPYHMDMIDNALLDADIFIAIGTSGTIYPAAGFVALARHQGARTIEINLEPSAQAGIFDEGFYGPATEQVPHFVTQLLEVTCQN